MHTYESLTRISHETLASLELNGAIRKIRSVDGMHSTFRLILLFHSFLRIVFSGNEALVRRHNMCINIHIDAC